MKNLNRENADILIEGAPVLPGNKALIMLHGRGGTAEDIISLKAHLESEDFIFIAPRAQNNAWYPYSFMAPTKQNEPFLTASLTIVNDIVNELNENGISSDKIYLLGFSQGACLALEYAARYAKRYGGVIAFTGGVIGDKLDETNYAGNFRQTPVFIGSADPDSHVPVSRVKESSSLFRDMNAEVMEKIYPGMGHVISGEELREVNEFIFNKIQ